MIGVAEIKQRVISRRIAKGVFVFHGDVFLLITIRDPKQSSLL